MKRYVRRSSIDTKKELSPTKGEEEKATTNKKKEEEDLLIVEEQQQRRPVISSPHSGFPTGSTMSVNRCFCLQNSFSKIDQLTMLSHRRQGKASYSHCGKESTD